MTLSTEWQPRGSERGKLVRAGRAYARTAARSETALGMLRVHVQNAVYAGMSVTDVAIITGLSRPAVYRALRARE